MKYVILGSGLEGRAMAEYYGKDAILLDDDKEASFTEQIAKIDGEKTIIRSPSIQLDKIPKDYKVWSMTNEFMSKCPATVIGVTGTKGKGTTATMIRDILQADGHKTWLVGNIGVPAISVLSDIQPTDLVVFEMSSFQLWDCEFSPHVAVVLRIEPAHLDVHRNLPDYVSAKANIVKYQTESDITVFYEKSPKAVKIADSSKAKKIPYPAEIQVPDTLTVPGEHNKENAAAAIAAATPFLRDTGGISKGLATFQPLPHHTEFVAEKNGVVYYDDSFSTAYPAMDVAVKSFEDKDIILIAGGKFYDHGNMADFEALFTRPNIKKVILLGEAATHFSNESRPAVSSLKEAVELASKTASSGDVVLLSPGFPSLDMFPSYKVRGEQFQKLVKSL